MALIVIRLGSAEATYIRVVARAVDATVALDCSSGGPTDWVEHALHHHKEQGHGLGDCLLLLDHQLLPFRILPREAIGGDALDAREWFVGLKDGDYRVKRESITSNDVAVAAMCSADLDAQHAAVTKVGFKFRGSVPTAWLVGLAAGEGEICFREGNATTVLRARAGGLSHIARRRDEGIATPIEEYVAKSCEAPALRRMLFRPVTREHSWARTLAVTTAATGLLVSLLVPPIRAIARAERAEAAIEALRREANRVAPVMRQIERAEMLERERSAFQALGQSWSRLTLLAELSNRLSDAWYVASMSVDSSAVSLVVVGHDVGRVPAKLAQSPGFRNVSISGPITPEEIHGRRAQRATVQAQVVTAQNRSARAMSQ